MDSPKAERRCKLRFIDEKAQKTLEELISRFEECNEEYDDEEREDRRD
jgi:hypothetical protein